MGCFWSGTQDFGMSLRLCQSPIDQKTLVEVEAPMTDHQMSTVSHAERDVGRTYISVALWIDHCKVNWSADNDSHRILAARRRIITIVASKNISQILSFLHTW